MKSWYSRVTDTVEKNRYTCYELRDFMTREEAHQIVVGAQGMVSAAQRKARADVDTQEIDRRELLAAQLAVQQMEAFCAVLPFVELM